MTAVTKFFFRAPYSLPTTGTVLRWWESRRLAYNLAVGTAGVLTLGVIALVDLLPPHARSFGVPWPAILVYAILANLFYSVGPALDALICRRWGRDFAEVGPTLFRYGFAFAVGLTLLPIPVALIGWALRILKAIL